MRIQVLVIGIVISLLVCFIGACSSDVTDLPSDGDYSSSGDIVELARSLRADPAQNSPQQAGIWVLGEGSVTIEPDLVLLSIGVEATALTVAEARGNGAAAMQGVVKALKQHGVQVKDIQTTRFNISPQYRWVDQLKDGIRSSKQVLVGYLVSNKASVKVRDLPAVGGVIDSVALAGGDLVRFDNIQFMVEDPTPFAEELRKAAVNDALVKARDYADFMDVNLGDLVYLTEVRSGSPIVQMESARTAFSMEAAFVETSIMGGELELNLTIQAVFSVD